MKRGRRGLSSFWSNRYVYLMLLPVAAYFLIFRYWPMGWLAIALYDYKLLRGFAGSSFVGFAHFVDFFTGLDIWRLIANTVMINVYALLFVFPAPIIFALLLNELRLPAFKRTVQTISYLPHFISTVVLVTMVVSFLSPSTGSLNRIVKNLGLEPIYFLGEPRFFRAILVVSGIWQNMGWSAVVYLAALSGIDAELYEAAVIDGAGRLRQVWSITLPSIRSTIIILFILQVGQMLSVNFEKVFLLQNPLNLSVSEVIATYVYKRGIQNANYSFATAVGIFNSVISLLLVTGSNAISKRASGIGLW